VPRDDLRLDRRHLDREGLDESAQVALRAFYTDPFFRYLAPTTRQRHRGLFLFFRTAISHLGPRGHLVTVRTTDDQIVGVSAWMAPGGYPQPMGTQLASIPGSFRALYRRPASMRDGSRYLTTIAKEHPKEPHWYLYLLCADPEFQRQGVGGLLLNDRLPQVDEEHVGSYLETQKQDNIAYYQRFGYEHKDTLRPVSDGPPIYTMWRPAR
jgi:GNAT superfamily N-acetyltransferase